MSSSLARVTRLVSAAAARSIPNHHPQHRALCDRVTARVLPQPKTTVGPLDIKSTDIGQVQDPHTNDPLKWRKFAWKYVGALIVFGVSYKALHWYVDSVAKEGKRRREDMEEGKTAVLETPEDRRAQREADAKKAAALLQQAKNPLGTVVAAKSGEIANSSAGSADLDTKLSPEEAAERENDVKFQVFKPVEEEEGFVSQEDELMLLEAELEARLKKLRAQKRSREIDEEKRQVKSELVDVRSELATFSATSKTQPSTKPI
jgi:hypothetical protein